MKNRRLVAVMLLGLGGLLLAGVLWRAPAQAGAALRAGAGPGPTGGAAGALWESAPLTETQIYLALVAAPGRLYFPVMMNPQPTPTPTPLPGPDIVDEILIPAGAFQMGCDISNVAEESCPPSQRPVHTVRLDAYYIDKYEVTNARYKACVDAGGCTPPWRRDSYRRRFYYGNPVYDNYPVMRVDWYQAAAFCTWAGKQLPSEAQWERAARGDQDTRKYPWGNEPPNYNLLNYNNHLGDTVAVGSYPAGASPFGVMDMAGNVWEWVNDWYAGDYYRSSPADNPPGPDRGSNRVRRGGSWLNRANDMRVSERSSKLPTHWPSAIGFRCVRPQ